MLPACTAWPAEVVALKVVSTTSQFHRELKLDELFPDAIPAELGASSHVRKAEHGHFYAGANLDRAKDISVMSGGHPAKCWCFHQNWATSMLNKPSGTFFFSSTYHPI